MPLVNVHVLRGRTAEQLDALLDAVHDAQVEAFGVPETDRYQLVSQHEPGEIRALDTGLGHPRSKDLVVLHFVSRRRTREQKVKLYELLAAHLRDRLGISGDDLIVTITENEDTDWSFGAGRAQFLTGELS
ncbi:tautomerase family protein [Sciscionella sediminilitoris]|uniref:tautomerase family protein n=1 Tax=Sciscionella sediminilitoris TaxID=1445613 RepID=UPI0004DF759D|nr:tautomerase family protein [Sciscionella sp. SE31]